MRGTASGSCAVALALLLAPAVLAARPVSVGYDSPAALRGLHVLATVAPLHVAEVSATDVGALRGRAGIRWIQSTVDRRRLGQALVGAGHGVATAEWQFTATRANLVPASVQWAAASPVPTPRTPSPPRMPSPPYQRGTLRACMAANEDPTTTVAAAGEPSAANSTSFETSAVAWSGR